MSFRFWPHSLFVYVGLACLGASTASPLLAQARSAGDAPDALFELAAEPAGPDAAKLKALDSAGAAERWLAREIPAGFALEDAPDFFEAADEVFFNAEESLWIYAYRSASTGKWIGWVAFDAERTAVTHTAAVAGAH